VLDRRIAVPELVGDHRDFLIVSGLAGTSRDMAAITDDAAHLFTMAGAMGAATSLGLGLALGQPDRKVLVVTGDGELLMNVGTLATVAALNPGNLAILCVDNCRYAETGHQPSHTEMGTDLEKMAKGAGIPETRTIYTEDQIADASTFLHTNGNARLVVVRVTPADPPAYKRQLDPAICRLRFREALLGHS
ncbi:thiamine pyrophosphate-dependent enzyme, partial [Pseudomonadota bacterium]